MGSADLEKSVYCGAGNDDPGQCCAVALSVDGQERTQAVRAEKPQAGEVEKKSAFAVGVAAFGFVEEPVGVVGVDLSPGRHDGDAPVDSVGVTNVIAAS